MRTIRYLLSATLISSAFAITAQAKDAGFALLPALKYTSNETTSSTTSKESEMQIDLALGYKMGSGLLLGASYIMLNGSQDASGTTTTTTFSGYGPTVGYIHGGGFFVKGTYLFSATLKSTQGSTDVTMTGDGIGFDFGYLIKLGASAAVGPTLGYSSVTYKKQKLGSLPESDLSPTTKITSMWLPGLQFAFVF